MSIATLTLREHLASIPDARVFAPSGRDEDIGQFTSSEAEASIDAPLVEDRPFVAIDVPLSTVSGFTHFLDGAQRSWRVGFVGMSPLYLAHTSAGLVARVEREVLPPSPDCYSASLEMVAPNGVDCPPYPGVSFLGVGVANEDSEMAVRQRIANAISSRREERETDVARSFRDGWLLIDGGIGKVIEKTPDDVQMVGVVKSHQRQYFVSRERVRTILDLKPGQRTPVFLRERNQPQGKEANSFYLRLFDCSNQSPLFGLIRVEIPTSVEMLRQVDEICSWLLAERDPLSLPDARYDRMIYPIRLVEKHLKARQPSEAAIRQIIGV